MSKLSKEEVFQTNNSLRSQYFVIGVIAFSQGVLGLSDLALSYLYKDDFNMSPAEVSFYGSIISLPWIMKPIWGIVSDSFPFLGYRRKSYLIIFSFCGFILWQCMAQFVRTKESGIIIQLMINLAVAFCNVIGEALIVEISQKKVKALNLPEEEAQAEASKNVSMFFGIRSTGTLITAFLSGELLEILGKREIFAITSLFPLSLLVVALFLEEKKIPKRKRNRDYDQLNDQDEQEQLNGQQNENQQEYSQIEEKSKGKIQWEKFWKFISLPEIYRPIGFIFLFMAVPSPGSSMFYFYTNELKFTPEFLGSLRFIYATGSISAVIIYNKFLKAVEFKKQFIWTTLLCIILGYSQILLVTRDNIRLGIPDKLFTLGDSVIIQVIGEINTMPLLVLACRMCPKDIEGTMYALLMSTLNFGGILSGQLGGIMTYFMGITETDFTYLWLLLFITNSLQLIPIFLLNFINMDKIQEIQDKHNNDGLILEQDEEQDTQIENDKGSVNETVKPDELYDTGIMSHKNYLSFDNTKQDAYQSFHKDQSQLINNKNKKSQEPEKEVIDENQEFSNNNNN